MPRQTYIINNFSGGVNNLKDSRDIADNESAKINGLMTDKQGVLRTSGAFVNHADGSGTLASDAGNNGDNQAGNGLFYFESDFGRKSVASTTSESGSIFGKFYPAGGSNPPQLSQSSSTIFNTYSIGDKISINGSASNDGVYTIIGKHDLSSFSGHQRYRFSFLEDLTSEDASSALTIDHYEQYGAKFYMVPTESADANDASHLTITIHDSENDDWNTLTDLQPIKSDVSETFSDQMISDVFKPVYYAIDNAVRVSDSNFKNQARVKWHGYIERVHPDQAYLGWYTKDNELKAPTAGDDVRLGNTYPDTAGVGLHWYILTPANTSSSWQPDTYETGMTFIYDGNQESQITEMQASYVEFAVAAGDAVTVKALMFTPYSPRISGSRLYFRVSGSDDEWTFLAEADFSKGIRASLDADYTSGWTTSGSANQYSTGTVTSLQPSLDTYETLNGWPSSTLSIDFGRIGEMWMCAAICNRRVFLANVKTRNEDSANDDSKHYGDRILYSEIGKYDTFPSFNFIDVVRGDSEEYVSLIAYGDRLLAFKQRTLFIVNVSSPSPSGWFLENTFKHNGVRHKEAAFRSDEGVVWVNSAGCWFYNGSNIVNLCDGKLDTVNATNANTDNGLSWKDFYNENSIVGYAPKYKQVIILQDSDGSTDPMNTLIYDFGSRSWVQSSDQTTFFDNVTYSNFIIDGNGDLVIQTSTATGTANNIRYYLPTSSTSSSGIELITKFLDFGNPYRLKKIYKINITYKSSAAQADPLEARYINSSGVMQSFTDVDGSVDFADTSSEWRVASFAFSTPITCQAVQLKINPPNAGSIDINEIAIDYRFIHKKVS
tara:strand:+ start:820 stop:3312 length:2493 start_codon:yes stop_codon:yes gene_type:complete